MITMNPPPPHHHPTPHVQTDVVRLSFIQRSHCGCAELNSAFALCVEMAQRCYGNFSHTYHSWMPNVAMDHYYTYSRNINVHQCGLRVGRVQIKMV